jgi:uncharacterized protein (TIGR03435 family)
MKSHDLMRIRAGAAISIALLAPTPLSGQDTNSRPAFEVASVKLAGPNENPMGRGIFTFPGGRITANKCTLAKLIEEAFDIQPFQLSGGPHWINNDRYDIVAKPPASSQSSRANPTEPKTSMNAEQRQMLQTLLVDRFRLRYHTETKEGPVYLLVRSGKELDMQEAKKKDGYPWAGGLGGGGITGDGLAGMNETMDDLCRRLAPYLGRPVLNKTGLHGAFDFKFSYSSGDPNPDVISVILESVQAIGLKLEGAKGPVGTLVIDSAEKPSEN